MWIGGAAPFKMPAVSRVSVLTPSFNQARFLAQNLASVARQGALVREHIVMDGGSSDGSRELLAQSNVVWRSERDGGQAEALNKALALATGEIVGWLNSDDLYCEGAVARAVALLDARPELAMVFGHCQRIDAEGKNIGSVDASQVDLEGMLVHETIPQPSCFLRRAALERVGGVDASYRYAMDYDLWLRLGLDGARWLAVDETWARFRVHGESKSGSEAAKFLPEVERALEAALASPSLPAHLAAQRPSLRRRFHVNIARAAYAGLELPLARAHLMRALSADPFGVDTGLITLAMKCALPEFLLKAWRSI